MSLEALKINVKEEKKLAEKLIFLTNQAYQTKTPRERKILEDAINSTINQIGILNNSLPELIAGISLAKKLPAAGLKRKKAKKAELISVSYETPDKEKKFIAIKKADREKYAKELSISDYSIKQLKKKKVIPKKAKVEFRKPSFYTKISNKFFAGFVSKSIKKGGFKKIGLDLRRANLNVTLNSYVSMLFFSVFLSFVIAVILMAFFLFFSLSIEPPFLIPVKEDILLRLLKVIWIVPGLPILVFLSFYFYPSTERDSLSRKIEYELPFVTIQMSAIASSGVEPSNIFKIIAMGEEYPNIKKEAKKIMNEINLYGYDLVNALKNIARASPSKKFAELLNGFSTTITSGGSLTEFLNKRADTLLFEYKLVRERYTKTAETFMDIYISVVIAAPMMFMLLLILMSMGNIGLEISIKILTLLIVVVVALINVIFLIYLHLSQKKF